MKVGLTAAMVILSKPTEKDTLSGRGILTGVVNVTYIKNVNSEVFVILSIRIFLVFK